MRLNFDMPQIERMSEGVILLDKQAQIKAYNPAAREWLQECSGLRSHLLELIKRASGAQLTLPTAVQLRGVWRESLAQPVDAWLCKDGRWDYMLFIARSSPEQAFKLNETRFVALLGEQTRQEMKQLGELLRTAANPGELDRAAILRQAARVDRALIEIDQLSSLFQRDKVFLADRLLLVLLIKDITSELPRQHDEYAIQYKLIETLDNTGVLYGDAAWMKYAIKNLLTELGKSAPPRSQVVLEVRQQGDFIVLTGRVHHTPGLLRPSTGNNREDTTTPVDLDIRLQICKRIIELHGGLLKVSMLSSEGPDEHSTGIESFTLNLLTGIPDHDRARASCTDCRYNLQAQAYAQDLAALLTQDSK